MQGHRVPVDLAHHGPDPGVPVDRVGARRKVPEHRRPQRRDSRSHGGGVFRQEWIFNKATLRLMGESTLWNGKVTSASALLDQGFVDHVGQVPRRGA